MRACLGIGSEDADAGDVAVRKRARVGYVEQESNFAPEMTVRAVLEAALARAKVPEGEHEGRLRENPVEESPDDRNLAHPGEGIVSRRTEERQAPAKEQQ